MNPVLSQTSRPLLQLFTQTFSNTTANMPHTELNSKAEFDQALQTSGKFVLIYAYEGSVNPKADE